MSDTYEALKPNNLPGTQVGCCHLIDLKMTNGPNLVFCLMTDVDVCRTLAGPVTHTASFQVKSTRDGNSKLTCSVDWKSSLPDKCALTGLEDGNKKTKNM